jgi:CheY-like chemotaxis protein
MLIQPVIFEKKERAKGHVTSYTWSPDSTSSVSHNETHSQARLDSEVYMPKTLHVEDSAEIRSIVKYFLKKQCELEFATDGQSALDMAKAGEYDIIIMDINLGEGIDGIETTRILREMEQYKDTPIIAVTANLSAQVRDHCLQVGMDAFLPKPFRKDDLLNTINYVLERRTIGA